MKKILSAVAALVVTGGVVFGGIASADTPASTAASVYNPVSPVRMLDTRNSGGALQQGAIRKLQVTGVHGVPANATAVVLSITVANSSSGGYLTAWPDGQSQPTVSQVSFAPNQIISDEVTVAVGKGGNVDLFNRFGSVNVIVDLEGYHSADSDAPSFIKADSANPTGAVVLKQIGGTIRTGVTKLTNGIPLDPGTYRITASGVFYRAAKTGAQGDPGVPNTYGTMVLWLDNNSDGQYDWTTGENAGTIQTPAIPRMTTDTTTSTIEAAANDTSIVTVIEHTTLYLGGFGYNDNTGNYGSAGAPGAGDFSVVPSMTVEKLNAG